MSDQEFRRALDVARGADIIIAAMGELQNMTGESASRASLALPGREAELLKALSALGKPIVLVLFNGRPLTIPWESEHIPAILEMWYPGSEGGNPLVDLLFGKANPAGKLPSPGRGMRIRSRIRVMLPVTSWHNCTFVSDSETHHGPSEN